MHKSKSYGCLWNGTQNLWKSYDAKPGMGLPNRIEIYA